MRARVQAFALDAEEDDNLAFRTLSLFAPVGLASASIVALFCSSGCVRSFVSSALADALSASGGVYATDDDADLVEAAVPFGLKTMEGVLAEEPEHVELLTALASGFVQYAFAFVSEEADALAKSDIETSMAVRKRARKLYGRARAYGIRGLEVSHEGFEEMLRRDPSRALAPMRKGDVPLLYWTAAAWGLGIGASKDDPQAIADLPAVGKLAERALELDESFLRGGLHEFFISYEAGTPGGSHESARRHFERAVELSQETRASPYVSLAENICVKEQNSREFHRLLARALAIDLDRSPEDRLANVVLMRRARRLEAASEDLFVDDVREGSEQP